MSFFVCQQTNDALVAPLIRLNHCHLGEAERMLKKYEKNSELIILYQTKGLHKKALELLQKQSTLQDPSLQGHERTVLYLQNLGLIEVLKGMKHMNSSLQESFVGHS